MAKMLARPTMPSMATAIDSQFSTKDIVYTTDRYSKIVDCALWTRQGVQATAELHTRRTRESRRAVTTRVGRVCHSQSVRAYVRADRTWHVRRMDAYVGIYRGRPLNHRDLASLITKLIQLK